MQILLRRGKNIKYDIGQYGCYCKHCDSVFIIDKSEFKLSTIECPICLRITPLSDCQKLHSNNDRLDFECKYLR